MHVRKKMFWVAEKFSKIFEKSRKISSTLIKSTILRIIKTPKQHLLVLYKVRPARSPVDYKTPIFCGVFGGVLFSLLYC